MIDLLRVYNRVRRERNELRRQLAWANLRVDLLRKMVDEKTSTDAAGWKRRAEVLYDIADRDLRDGVLGTLDTIEAIDEVKP